jgi:lactate dehydrogenase-like 2-hydroxyacid dehydrogenase
MRTLQILGMGGYESAKLVRKGFKQKIHICQKNTKKKKKKIRKRIRGKEEKEIL